MKKSYFLLDKWVLFLALFSTLFGCNNPNSNDSSNSIDTVRVTVFALGETMQDMKFEPNTITIPEKSVLELKLLNKSTAIGMFHNIVFCESGSAQKVGFKGIAAGRPNDYIPDMKEVIIGSKMLEMGDSTTLTFPAPPKGNYDFICSFPGHYTLMKGVLTVN